MATHKLFAYGTLLNPGTFARMTPNLEELISIEPAYIEGKMYTNGASSSFPFVIKPDDKSRTKSPWFVYGGLITFKGDNELWRTLDSYEGCSKSSFGENRDTDLYYRETTKVTVIDFESMSDFIKYDFKVVREDEAEVYLGNYNTMMVQNAIGTDRRAGTVWRSFFNMQIKKPSELR